MDNLCKSIHREVVERIRLSGNVDDDRLLLVIDEVIGETESHLSLNKKIAYRKEILQAIRGLDIMEDLLIDPAVTEIMVNGHQNIFIEKDGKILRYCDSFSSEEKLLDIIQKIVAGANRIVNESSPVVDARLPDGSRINVVLPPVSLIGPVLTIRKFPRKYTMEDLVETGMMGEDCACFLKEIVEKRLNIFVSGGTGTGKTTVLNALAGYIPLAERVITIEDSAELQLEHPNLVRMEARARNLEGEHEINIRDLIRTALRMRPDRIIVGEVRSEEALDMLQAMNTGHDGSFSTGHSNSNQDMLSRLEIMTLTAIEMPLDAVKGQIASAIDVMIHLKRLEDGSRKVTSIDEVTGYEGGRILLHNLFEYDYETMQLRRTGGLLSKKADREEGRRKACHL